MKLKLCNVVREGKSQVEEEVLWETHHVIISKVRLVGLGIAVSGGYNNPCNGDPSIVISDVIKIGPAEGKLKINDRVLSVNGHSFDHVDQSTAIQVIVDCGDTVNMVVSRPVVSPCPAVLAQSSVPLTKKNNRSDSLVRKAKKVISKVKRKMQQDATNRQPLNNSILRRQEKEESEVAHGIEDLSYVPTLKKKVNNVNIDVKADTCDKFSTSTVSRMRRNINEI